MLCVARYTPSMVKKQSLHSISFEGKLHKLHLFSLPRHPVPGLNLGCCMIPDKPSASELDSKPSLVVFILKQGLNKLLRLALNFLCSAGRH